MLKPEFTGQFKRDYKLAMRRGLDPRRLEAVVTLLCLGEPLPAAYRDHALTDSAHSHRLTQRPLLTRLRPRPFYPIPSSAFTLCPAIITSWQYTCPHGAPEEPKSSPRTAVNLSL